MEHFGFMNLILALIFSVLFLKYWKAVLAMIAACLVALAFFGLLTLLMMMSGHGW